MKLLLADWFEETFQFRFYHGLFTKLGFAGALSRDLSWVVVLEAAARGLVRGNFEVAGLTTAFSRSSTL